jgi:molybdate transport system ATP-binding protein
VRKGKDMLEVAIRQQLGRFKLDVAFQSDARVVALFGRSGSGKSSVINAIAGVSRPDTGRIVLDGEVFYDSTLRIFAKPETRRIGYVFQDGLLFPHLSVERNLSYGRKPQQSAQETERVISLLGLGSLLARKPDALSGGEKQRVAIGRALLSSPRLLLLDEPLAALDSPRKAEILQYIELLRDEFRIPIVLVSHAMEEVARLADTLVLMDEGKVVASGSVESLMGRLDLHPFTGRHEAGAIIETTVGTHDEASDITTLNFPGGQLHAPGVASLSGERVRVRIRARDVALALTEPQDISMLNILPGTITALREDAGATVDVQVQVGEAKLIARITRHSAARLKLEPDLRIFALVKAISLDRRSVGYA